MPRLGVAFQPYSASNKTVVRGSCGIFYAATPLLLFANPINNFHATPGNLSLAHPTTEHIIYEQFLAVGIDLDDFPLDGVLCLKEILSFLQNQCFKHKLYLLSRAGSNGSGW